MQSITEIDLRVKTDGISKYFIEAYFANNSPAVHVLWIVVVEIHLQLQRAAKYAKYI